jgi:hypothetical protein
VPATPDLVAAWLKLTPTAADDALLTDVCAAVNDWVARLEWVRAGPDPNVWPRSADQGAVMLAARMYRRRNTPGGVESFTDTVIYVPRRDSDVDQLLRVGAYQMPGVG